MSTKEDWDVAHDEANALWDSLGLKAKVTGPTPDVKEEWPCLKFILKVQIPLTLRDEVFEYRMGIGHAKNMKAALASPHKFRITDDEYPALSMMMKGRSLTNKHLEAQVAMKCFVTGDTPLPSTIICSCAGDAQAHDESFEEWCGNLGMDPDSCKAELIYRQCLDQWHKLRKLGLDVATINKFAELSNRF